jgi:Zn-dependent metalloprotease/subtilisin family serine protease
MKVNQILRGCSLSLLISLAAWPCFAFRADEKIGSVEAEKLPQLPPLARRELTVDQRTVVQQGKDAGLLVEWDTQRGTPIIVRGTNLGLRRAYSGGKALTLSTGGNVEVDALAVLDNLSRFYGIRDAAQEFSVKQTDSDALGFRHVRMMQKHQGLRVVGGDLIVHFNQDGAAYQVSGQYVPDIQIEISAKLSDTEAARVAQENLSALGYTAANLEAAPTLVVLARNSAPRLAYELILQTQDAKTGPGRWRFWIDAQEGTVLWRYDDIQKIAAPTANGNPTPITGNILAGEGGQSVSVTGWYENTGFYYLYNTNRRWFVYDVATSGYSDFNTYAFRALSDWGTTDRAEMSVGYNFEIVQNYYQQMHGRYSFNNAGIYARANIHEGVSYVNAYWNGSAFYFGDGNGSTANCLATLDISGHEYTHAVTEYTAGLVYSYESGALNESFSDVMGASIEFFGQPDGRGTYPAKSPGQADWLCGEDSWLSSTALRDLRNPRNTATVGSGNEQPSRYQGTYWYSGTGDNGGVHYNSGVQNFFFYLLCEGGSGDNDGIGYNLTGIGVTNAAQVAYRALTVYCTPNTDYRAVRSAWISAALDLNPSWAPNVSAAWSAVGVGALAITPAGELTFRGPVGGPFTPSSQTYTLVNSGATLMNWGAATNQTWLNLSPASGTISANGSQIITLTVNGDANALPFGIYTNLLTITNDVDVTSQTRSVVILSGQTDSFTELFDTTGNDLDFNTFTFTPNNGPSGYSLCRETASSFPTDPTGGTTIFLSDDTFAQVTLAGGSTVAIYNRRTNVFYVGSNGYLTMNSGDSSLGETFAAHFNRPRVSACFDDLNPASGGTVSWKQTAELVAVTFANVREYGTTATVSFQIEMFFDGRIRITYLAVNVTDGLAGISAGLGVPIGFVESDLSSYGACVPPDGLVVTPATGLAAQGYEGGPFAPTSASYTLANQDVNSLTWSATATEPWVTIDPAAGELLPGANTGVSVQLNAAALSLPPGNHSANVIFSNLTTGFTQARSVTLQVLAIPGQIGVTDSVPPANDLQMPFGNVIVGLARMEHVTVTNLDPTYSLVISDISFGSYTENFNDGLAQDWVTDVPANWQVVSGEYRAQTSGSEFMTSRYTGRQWADLTVQMSCRRTGSPDYSAGVALRASTDFDEGAGAAYVFQISQGGFYGVWKQSNGVFTWLQSWTATALNPVTNLLTAVAQGSQLRFYINGNLVWSGIDATLTNGHVGLLGYTTVTTPTVHYFDNVAVSDPTTNFTVISPQQLLANARPVAGSGTELSPHQAPPGLSANPNTSDDWRALSVVSGPWRLENVPGLPAIVPPGGTVTFDVVYQPVATGSNYSQVVIQSNDANEPEVNVQVTGLAIQDYLRGTPTGDFAAQGHPGGPFSPASTGYVLSNAGPVAISWTTTHTQTWVNVTPANGALAVGQSVNVTVVLTAAANALSEGNYADLVTFSNVTTTVAQTRGVTLNVFTSPGLVVSPLAIAVTNVLGGTTNVGMIVSNSAAADGQLTFRIATRETGRSLLELAATGVGLPPANHDFTQIGAADYEPEQLLVRFANDVAAPQRAQLLNSMGGAEVVSEFKLVPGLCLVKLPSSQPLSAALVSFNQSPGILYAEPNYQVKTTATIPNDVRFSELWGLHNTGQSGGTVDADIDAPEAWDVNTGSSQVVVAVIDTGVDYSHPDLTNNAWMNPGEIPGNSLDDDNNGYVDDVFGYDFVNSDGNPMDDNGHGTHCAGTIGGRGNNSIGVAGVNWQVRIMGCKFLAASGSGSTANAILCVQYATQMGAKVMNNSWGGGGFSQALKDAIDAAGAAGVIFVAAAGNDSLNNDTTPHYPSSYASSNIVAVMATDRNDVRSTFSNYGQTSVHLAAPGTSILSCQPGGGYQLLSGTSMATPHVSGACALLLAANPALTPGELKQILMTSTDSVVPGQCISGGRLNVNRALLGVGAGWITVTPVGATNVPPGSAVAVNVEFAAGELSPGTYSGELLLSANDLINPNTTIPVTMTVLPDSLQLSPTNNLVASGLEDGPFDPTNQVYAVQNVGTASLNWSATCTQSWVMIDPPGGALAGGAAVNATVKINANAAALDVGVHFATVTFSNLTSGVTRTRTVQLTVNPRPLPPGEPVNPTPAHNATVVSVHTQLSWNSAAANSTEGAVGSFGVIDISGYDPDAVTFIQSLPGLTATAVPWSTVLAGSGAALFATYDNLYFAVNASATDYQNLRTAVTVGQPLEQFVTLGGTLVLNLAGNNGNQTDLGPGGLDYDRTYAHETATIVDPQHPFITGIGYGGTALTSNLFNTWSSTDHGNLTGLPVGAVMLLQNSNGTSMVEYPWGAGRVIASTLTYGWAGSTVRFGPAFSNEVLYAASGLGSGSATHYVYLGTSPSALSLIASNLTQTTCDPGPLAFNTTYYWQVISSNVVGSVTGAVWNFTTALDEVHFAAATSSATENAGTAAITVTRENVAGGPLTIQYATANGTATAGADYTTSAGTLTFPNGVLTTNFSVPILDDAAGEGSETILLSLSVPPANVLLAAPSNAVLTIGDNDGQVVSLPYTLFDSQPYQWDISSNGSIGDGTSDAYDGGHVCLNFPSFSTGVLLNGRELFIGPTTQSGLELTRRIYVPSTQSYARFLEVLRNPGATPITTTVRLDTNLGSDGGTVMVATSSGDLAFGTNDDWIVTDDTDGSGDPTVLHVTANAVGSQRPSAVSYSTGALGYQYSVTVPPGETRIVMHFGAQSPNRATAQAKAATLLALDATALFQISADDRARIVNFAFPDAMQVTPPEGLVSSGPEGGSFNPSNKVYVVSNPGAQPLTWAVNPPSAWVPVLTNTSANAIRVITLNSPQQQRFFRAAATNGTPPSLSALSYTNGQFQFTLTGQANATYVIECLTDLAAQSWLSVTPSGGVLAPGTSTNVTVAITETAAAFSPGIYSATVIFRNQSNGSSQTRNAQLTVVGAGSGTNVAIIPTSATSIGNCIPFGGNTEYGFTGFIYRDVPAFVLVPGDRLRFDLGFTNNVEVRRNIYIAAANLNPVAGGGTQNVQAQSWLKIVSDTQVPTNPRGNTIVGDYELTYTAESAFSFSGGGLIIAFGAAPPGSYSDPGCDQVLIYTSSSDASGNFHRRFYNHADQSLGILDGSSGGLSDDGYLAGFMIESTGSVTGLHHFTWNPINATQLQSVAFPVSLSARTLQGNLVSNFNGAVTLTGWCGGSNVLFSANFDTDGDGFTYTPDVDAASNLWHRTSHRYVSPGFCQYYGVEGSWNFETGNHNAGNLLSPAISLVGATPPISLNFKYLLNTESSLGYDVASVDISTNSGANWITLASRAGTNPLVNSVSFTNWSGDLSAYAGANLRLRFNFDTIDSAGNTFEGWYVDDVSVSAYAGVIPVAPTNMSFTNGIWSGNVAIAQSVAGVLLRATAGTGQSGDSLTFNVINRPTLIYQSNQAAGTLGLSWIGSGFRLQAQTNSLGAGLSTNWFDYPGGNASPVTITRDPANPSVFFRLIGP